MTKFGLLPIMVGLLITTSGAVAQDTPITLKEAVQLASVNDDPSVQQHTLNSESARENGEASAQLPNPKIKFGVANIAVDSFKFNQEGMTQAQFGVHQSFPSGTKRRLMRERGEANGAVFMALAAERRLGIKLRVEQTWLALNHQQAIASLISEKRERLVELLDSMAAKYETGKTSAQSILAMEAELALLEDRTEAIEQETAKLRIALARYIGFEPANRPLAGSYSDIGVPMPLLSLEESLIMHPSLLQEQAAIKAKGKSEKLARESYKPNWGMDLGYGYRAGGRSDMATAMVTVDLPLFGNKKQDKSLSAAKKSKQASMLKMQAKEMDMLRELRSVFVVWQRTSKRIDLYNKVVLERTKSASAASENSYATGNSDFAEIIRTHLSELDARLRLEAIYLERALSVAKLKFFQGDMS